MSETVLLDSAPLGMLSHPRSTPENEECRAWLKRLLSRGVKVGLPEIADYEVRRELLRAEGAWRGTFGCASGSADVSANFNAAHADGRRRRRGDRDLQCAPPEPVCTGQALAGNRIAGEAAPVFPQARRIAVKAINHLGDEVMSVRV